MSDDNIDFAKDDIFSGWVSDDIPLIRDLISKLVEPDPSVWIDTVGVKLHPDYCPWGAASLGIVDDTLPLPNYYSCDGVEYAALALALRLAAGQERFVVGEIGAGFAPWISSAAVAARRLGIPKLTCVAVEADPDRFRFMRQHLALNEIVPGDGENIGRNDTVSWRLFNTAVNATDGYLYWPAETNPHDAGIAATADSDASADYRGVKSAFKRIDAVSLDTAFAGVKRIDFLHIDIQGGEADLILNTLPFLNSRVSTLFIGTHSRSIEGRIIDALYGAGWNLLREKPCQFYSMASTPKLEGRTWADGAQFWNNDTLAR